MYEGSRRFPLGRACARGIEEVEALSSSVTGDVGGVEIREVEGRKLMSRVAVDAEVDVNDSGVIPGENVYVGFRLSLSTSGGMSLQRVRRVKLLRIFGCAHRLPRDPH